MMKNFGAMMGAVMMLTITASRELYEPRMAYYGGGGWDRGFDMKEIKRSARRNKKHTRSRRRK